MSSKEWNDVLLEDVCSVITDGSHSSPPSVQQGFYMASVKDMDKYKFNFEECRMISEDDYQKLVKNGCKPLVGDVLVGKDGAKYLDDVFVFNQQEEVVILSSIAILRPDKTKIMSEYLYYVLSDARTKNYIRSNYGSGSAIPRMVLKNFKRVSLNIPNLPIQKRIVTILSSLDDKIALNNRMNKVLEQMAQALFKQWFVDFEFPNGNDEPYKSSGGEMEWCEELGKEIPVGWNIHNISDLIESVSKTYKFKNEEIIFLNTSDILEGEVLHNNYSPVMSLPGQAKKSIMKNDILYSEIRPANKRFAYIDFDADEYVVSTKLMVLRTTSYVDPVLIYFYLTNQDNINYLQMVAESRSGTFPQITFQTFDSMSLAIGPETDMNQLTEHLKSLFIKIRRNNKQNNYLSKLRDTLLPKLMSGEIDVSEIEL
ncbi:EcoKI restriction-modification system protein HsdS [compost metagenome]